MSVVTYMNSNLLECWAKAKSVHMVKLAVLNNLTPIIKSRFTSYDRRDFGWHSDYNRRNMRVEGSAIGKYKAIAQKYYTNELLVADHAMTAVIEYLCCLDNQTRLLRNKIEPVVDKLFDRMRSNGEQYGMSWESINMYTLHPVYENARLGDEAQAEYNKLSQGWHRINFLHVVHVSELNPAQIAYFPTLRHFREDRPVRTTVGKYLTKYKELYGLRETTIKAMAEKYMAKMQARAGWTLNFVEHNDPEGWVRVYASEHVGSCMRGMSAVRVYAHDKSVLRLAYLTDGVNNVIARCIVRDDDEKGWLRVYPDPNGSSEGRFLLDTLIAAGYNKRTNLDGVLLQAIPHGSGYVCPYLDTGEDGAQSVDTTRVDGELYLVVDDNGEYDASNTDGMVGERYTCDCCGDSCDEDDLTYIDCESQSVCEHCRDEHYVYAYGSRYEEYFPREDCVCVGSEWYLMETANNHDIYLCDYDDEWYHSDDLYFFDEGSVHVDDAVCVDHMHDGSEYVHPDYVHTLSDGTTCHSDDADEYQAEIDERNGGEAESDDEVEPKKPDVVLPLMVGSRVKVLVDNAYWRRNDVGTVLKLDTDNTVLVDFNAQGNDKVIGDGHWWVYKTNVTVLDNQTNVVMSEQFAVAG